MLAEMAKRRKRIPAAVSEYLAVIGRKGGKTTPKKPRGPAALSPEKRKEIARNAARARWGRQK